MRKLLFLLLIPLFFFMYSDKSFAQTPRPANSFSMAETEGSLGVARMIEVPDKNVKDGTIISTGEKGAVLSIAPYDPHVVGVVARDASMIINSNASDKSVPVISDGRVYILVSAKAGPIKKGDLLTTSTIPGVAIKAIRDGYVLGMALDDYSNPDPKQIEKIAVDLDLHYFNAKPTFAGALSDLLKIAFFPTREAPTPIFKYIVAALVVLGSFVLGFLTFGRTAAKGVEALGRNPSASKIIHLGILFNISIVIAIVLAGLTVAFLILRL